MNKSELINGIHLLVSNNVLGEKQLMSRYKGFKGELFYDNLHKERFPQLKIFQGGTIISLDNQESSLNNSFYYTMIPKSNHHKDLNDYILIYNKLSNIGFIKMFLIIYDDAYQDCLEDEVMVFESEKIVMKIPGLEILNFNINKSCFQETNNGITEITQLLKYYSKRKRNLHSIPDYCKKWLLTNLNGFSKDQLLQIYMDRLILDGYIGFAADKGKISDIDLIVKKYDSFRLIEIKEKDLPKKTKKGFGLDVPRIKDLARISKMTNMKYFIVVRHINNQTERKLVGWKYIDLKNFINDAKKDKAVKGGTGMRSVTSYNPTLICSFQLFKDL